MGGHLRRGAVSSEPSGSNGVTMAVSTVPNRALTSNPLVLTGTKVTRSASRLRDYRSTVRPP